MKIAFAEQFMKSTVVPEPGENADAIIEKCLSLNATIHEDGLDKPPSFIVTLRPDVGPELWSEEALRRSMKP